MSLLTRRQSASTNADLNRLANDLSITNMKGLRIEGQISARDDMYIDAEINGPITSSARVTIGPNGAVRGPIKARELVVFGHVRGNIDAAERAALGEGADVVGDICTLYVSLHEKAYFKGSVDCSAFESQTLPFPPASESPNAARASVSA
jgi:cytoskeletal protein CcmA (bactofilin family)